MIYLKILFTSVCVVTIFTGCVSKDTKQLLSQYAIKSSEAQKNIMSTYKDTLDNNQRALYYKAVRDGATINDLQAIKIDYSGQIKLLADLVSFSESMAILTGDSFNNKVDDYTSELYRSAKNLSENEAIQNNTSKEDLQLFATLVDGAFRSYLEYERTKKLKELILLSDRWVQASIDSLDKDLEQWKNLLKRSIHEQKDIKIMILNYPYTYCQVKNPDKKCIPLSETFNTKVNMYEDVALQEKRLDNIDEEFKALSNSITIMSKLHKKVIESLKRDDINKEELSRIFNDLKEQVDSINKFRNDVKEEK